MNAVSYERFPRVIEHCQPGDHLCCIYETEEEHRAVVTPFLRQGLERGEKVVYIVDAHTAQAILGYLRESGPSTGSGQGLDVEQYLASGQLSILTRDDAYLRDGAFDPERMIALLRAETERALAEGYPALRVTGEMTWALRGLPGSERLIEYEARLNEFFPGSRCLAICQYDRRRFDAALLLDVLRTHPIAVIGTEVYDNFYYVPPAEFLGEERPTVELRHWVRNLAQRAQAEEALRRSEYLLRQVLDTNPAVIFVKDYDSRVLLANKTMAGFYNLSVEEVTGRLQSDLHRQYGADPKEVDKWLANDREVIETGHPKHLVESGTDSQGRQLWFRTGKYPIDIGPGRRGVLVISEDITERKQAEQELRESYAKLRTALGGTIEVLVSAVEMKDPYTAGHQRRVADLARAIATEMGLSKDQIEGIRMAGAIHDIGKISIPAEILSKPSQLNELEWGLIKTHPEVSYNILSKVEFPWPVAEMVLQHHERLDGSGYPQGLLGEEIMIEARILAVADVVEAMSSYRPYRPARTLAEALEEITRNRGVLYDPEAVDVCLKLFTEKRFEFVKSVRDKDE